VTAASEAVDHTNSRASSHDKPCPQATPPQIDVTKITDFELSLLMIERDTAQFKAGLIDELLNSVGQARGLLDAQKEGPQETKELDLARLPWEKRQGEKGEYEQTSERASQNSDVWKQLKAKLKEHKGFWQNSGYKFWFHQQDETVIDRRKAQEYSSP